MIKKTLMLVSLVVLCLSKLSMSAEFNFQPQRTNLNSSVLTHGLLIEGKINSGDYDKFLAQVKIHGKEIMTIYLGSGGGDLAEAMKIGQLIREMRYKTQIPYSRFPSMQITSKFAGFVVNDKENLFCASSCFFMFISGIDREGTKLGIHRPFFSKEFYKSVNVNIGDAIIADKYTRNAVKEFMSTMGAPEKYLEPMFRTPSNDIYWLPITDIANDFEGYIPEIQEWLNGNCNPLIADELSVWNKYGDTPSNSIPNGIRETMSQLSKKFTSFDECAGLMTYKMSLNAYKKKFQP